MAGNDMRRREWMRLSSSGLLALWANQYLPAQRVPKSDPNQAMPIYLPRSSGEAAGIHFANTPEWARQEPGLFVSNSVDSGAGLLRFPHSPPLPQQIQNFRNLPKLVREAQSLGTNIVYLVDWFTTLGDWLPKPEMGGEDALREGIAAAHDAGGRIVIYVEGLLIAKESVVGKAHGAEWSILQQDQQPLQMPYPQSFKMCPAASGWNAYLEDVAKRLASYGADGIYFDDWGDPETYQCYSRNHGHPVGELEVYNRRQITLAKQVRAVLEKARPEGAIILTEGTANKRHGLYEFIDGSLSWGLPDFALDWIWDAQGQTDTFVPAYPLDFWNQIVAFGAKLACPRNYLDGPPKPSAAGFLDKCLSQGVPEGNTNRFDINLMWGLHQWRNAALILGLQVPGFGDIAPTEAEVLAGPQPPKPRQEQQRIFESLRPRAAAIDDALRGHVAPSAKEYLKTLLTARRGLSAVVDHVSSVARVEVRSPHLVGWRFTGPKGTALTTANVDDAPQDLTFMQAPGMWKDLVTDETFSAKGNSLAVTVPAHRVRLLLAQGAA
jgi:hypothetical protein